MSVNCYKCGSELDLTINKDVPRSEECHHCFVNIRCCKMCSFFDTKAYNECREPTSDRIVDKEKSNFCDHYKVGSNLVKTDEKSDLLQKANSLFK